MPESLFIYIVSLLSAAALTAIAAYVVGQNATDDVGHRRERWDHD